MEAFQGVGEVLMEPTAALEAESEAGRAQGTGCCTCELLSLAAVVGRTVMEGKTEAVEMASAAAISVLAVVGGAVVLVAVSARRLRRRRLEG